MSHIDTHAVPASRHGGLLPWALLGLLALTWLDLRRCHARRRLERTPAPPETLQTWEGEGGGIPAVRGSGLPTPDTDPPLAD